MRKNKYPLPLTLRLRLRYGMYWDKNLPPFPWREFAYLVVIMAIWAMAMDIGYLEEQRDKAVSVAEENANSTQMLLDCLNGKLRLFYDTIAPNKGAYGKTVVFCNPPDELPL